MTWTASPLRCCSCLSEAIKILNNRAATVEGGAALRNHFQRGLELYPTLHFELLDLKCGLSNAILYCSNYCNNQTGTGTAEFNGISYNLETSFGSPTIVGKRLRLSSC